MKEVFLSASIPERGRGDFFASANPFLIQLAVRELIIAAHGKRRVIWGGHPAITPMVVAVCDDLQVSYSDSFLLFQSEFFRNKFPQENELFDNVVFTKEIPNDRDASLYLMRREMLNRPNLVEAVFVGGMEGCLEEHRFLKDHRPSVRLFSLAATGGAALQLAEEESWAVAASAASVNFSRVFRSIFV